ncbi:MAG: hypothetical protein AB7L76_06380 [Burkholderiaceae bacterium]
MNVNRIEDNIDADSVNPYVRPGEALSVRIRVARTDSQLKKAIKVRTDAFLRHLPEVVDSMCVVEDDDIHRGSLVLLCESKTTGEAIGTLRICTNIDEPTYLERTLRLPEFMRGSGLAYVSRLAVINGRHGMFAKLALFKALYRYCYATQISWMLAVAREPVDREFVRLGFEDLLPDGERLWRPADFGHVFVRPLYFNVVEAEERWRRTAHPLYDFMIKKFHPDIEVFSSVSGSWAVPRRLRELATTGAIPPVGSIPQILSV